LTYYVGIIVEDLNFRYVWSNVHRTTL